MAVRLQLDHASLAVPDLDAAIEVLAAVAGLETARSPAGPDRHGRVHLDRTYLEVAADPALGGWQCPLFFLRFDDLGALRDHLSSVGIAHRVGTYQGVDGTWDDVEISAGEVPLPILVRRTQPPEIAADWPPALKRPHPGGATTLARVHVTVSDLDVAARAYARLLGIPGAPGSGSAGQPSRVFATPPGQVVLSEGAGSGIAAIVLGVSSDVAPRSSPATGSITDATWLDLPVESSVRIGLVPTRRAPHEGGGSV